MHRICLKIVLISAVIYIVCSCSNSQKEHEIISINPSHFVEKVYDYNDVYFGLITGVTSGPVSKDQPVLVIFDSDIKLKKVFGEVISEKVFDISPKIKGEVFWKNEHTIGYKFLESPKDGTIYNCKFKLKEFVDSPSSLPDFPINFFLKKQDFFVSTPQYLSNSDIASSCSLMYYVRFAYPISDAKQVLKMINENIANNYNCDVQLIDDKLVKLTIPNIERKEKEFYSFDVKFDGKVLDVNKLTKSSFSIPPKNELHFLSSYLDPTDRLNRTFVMEFSNALNNINDLLFQSDTDNSKIAARLKDNCIIVTTSSDSYYYNNMCSKIMASGRVYDIMNHYLLVNQSFDVQKNISNLPDIKWIDDGYIIPNDKNASIYFEAVNLNSVILRVIKIYDNNVIDFLRDNYNKDSDRVRKVGRLVKKIVVNLPTDNQTKPQIYKICLSDYVDVKPGELYQVTLDYDMPCYVFACDDAKNKITTDKTFWDDFDTHTYYDDDYYYNYDYKTYWYDGSYYDNDPCMMRYYNDVEIKRNMMVSEIALTVKYNSENEINIFTRNINSVEPVPNCKISVYNYQKQIITQGKTNAEGYCCFNISEKPYFVEVSNKELGKAYLELIKNKSLSISSFDISGQNLKNGVNGFIYTNRGVWRPGDSIFLDFILSDPQNQVPDNFPVIIEVFDSNGRLMMKKVNNYPLGNIYSYSLSTEPSDPTGSWNANVYVGNQKFSKSLRVETVKPNGLKIDLNLPELISVNKQSSLNLSSSWLNGMVSPKLKVNVDVKLTGCGTTFKNYPNYSFDAINAKNYSNYLEAFTVGNSDANGKYEFPLARFKDFSLPGFANAIFVTTIFEGNGDFSVSSSSCKISPYSRYVGVELPEPASKYGRYYFTDQNWVFPVVLLNEDGTLNSNVKDLSMEVYKLDNYWWYGRDDNYLDYNYNYNSHLNRVKYEKLYLKNGKTNFTLNFTDAQWGDYLIVVKDSLGGHEFSSLVQFDYPYYKRNRENGKESNILSLKTDKNSYTIGEKIKISFPANAKAKALLTVENSSKVISFTNVSNLLEDGMIEINATKDMFPNSYIYISLYQPYSAENDVPVRLYGVVPVTVDDPKTVLYPVISMPETSTSKRTIDIEVSEKTGKQMYYTLSLVDEGILGLTSFKTPDPHKLLYAKRSLLVNTWDNYKDVIEGKSGKLTALSTTGGDMNLLNQESVLSKRFKAISTHIGPFELKPNEKTKHSFYIPEYSGSIRAMVVATDGKMAFGSSQCNVTVKDKISIFPAAPKVVSPNDEFIFPVQIFSADFAGKKVDVNITAFNLSIEGKSNISLNFDAQGEANTQFKIKVKETSGVAKLVVNASAANDKAEATVNIPIRMPLAVNHKTIMEKIDPNEEKTINLQFEGINGTTNGQLTLSSLVPIDLFSHLDYLISYPHGCLEQTISKGFPQLYLDCFVNISDAKREEIKANVNATILRINDYLRKDYSLSLWIGANYVNAWSEVYATHFLIEAQNRGYKIHSNTLNGIIKHQSEVAKSWSNYNNDDVEQAYRLFVLALNKTPEIGAMNKFKELTELQPLSKVFLSAAYSLSGKEAVAKSIIAEVKYQPNKVMSDWYNTYGSFTRDYAILTYAEMLTKADADHLRQSILNIAKDFGEKKWMSTQTVSFSLFVLGKYAEKQKGGNTNINASININGKNESVNTNQSSIVADFVPLKNNIIKIRNTSGGLIYATAYIKGYVAEYDTVERGETLKMKVDYFDKQGNKIDHRNIERTTQFYAEITIENTDMKYKITDNALTYMIPSGWEIFNTRLYNDESSDLNYADIRDDRAFFYFDLAPLQKIKIKLDFVALYSGKYTLPQVLCEDMYNNNIYYTVPATKVEVK